MGNRGLFNCRRDRAHPRLPGAGVIIQYHLERRTASVPLDDSSGYAGRSLDELLELFARGGCSVGLGFSARNSGSLTMASNAVRNTFTLSAGMPGGAMIERHRPRHCWCRAPRFA